MEQNEKETEAKLSELAYSINWKLGTMFSNALRKLRDQVAQDESDLISLVFHAKEMIELANRHEDIETPSHITAVEKMRRDAEELLTEVERIAKDFESRSRRIMAHVLDTREEMGLNHKTETETAS